MDFAIIKTGGKQYKVKEGDVLNIEKIDKEEGDEVVFDQVLMKSDDGDFEIGTPVIKGSKVSAKVLSHGKGEKVTIFRYKPKNRHRRKVGHRQPYTKIEIQSVN
ncbi:MAG TPA: 50S ribosomal protein L21 [Candidatus Paceibacterota bacterium]|nr:50S ribosomal protein L21 [Candidatus Paceibacterota bacterium]